MYTCIYARAMLLSCELRAVGFSGTNVGYLKRRPHLFFSFFFLHIDLTVEGLVQHTRKYKSLTIDHCLFYFITESPFHSQE